MKVVRLLRDRKRRPIRRLEGAGGLRGKELRLKGVLIATTAVLLAGCGAAAQTVTVTTSTAASTTSSTSQRRATHTQTAARRPPRSSPCPATEFDPYGPQGGCYTTPDPSRTTNPVSCPAGKEPSDGGCASPSEINGTPTTTTRTTTSAVDCQHDGTGGGTWVASANGGAGGCQYSIDVSQWCQRPGAFYTVVAPPGVFLVLALNDGYGSGTFRWSDGTQALARVC